MTTIVFASGLREGLAGYLLTATRTNGDISVSRESAVGDGRVMTVLAGQPQTQQVLAIGHGPVAVPGVADPLDGLAFRGDAAGLGWSTWQLRPGSDAHGYAAAVQAQEPDFLTVTVNAAASNATIDVMNAIMRVFALVLGLLAAVGVFSTMLLHVRERTRDVAILKAVGMTPRQLLAMVMTASAVLGIIAGLAGLPLGVLTHNGLITELGHQFGNNPPPILLDVLRPHTLYPLGLTGLAIALAGALLPARRAARSRIPDVLRSE